jgi:hypothetical protein
VTLAELLSANFRGMLGVLQARIADLTDEEMAWEPVDGCLRMGQLAPRVTHFDGVPEPVSTIGWRLEHIATGMSEERVLRWLAVEGVAPTVQPHGTADQMRLWVAASVDWFCSLVASIDDEHLWQPMGPVAGGFGDGPRAGFVMHLTNDAIHHGAEVGVLRDLWRAGLR